MSLPPSKPLAIPCQYITPQAQWIPFPTSSDLEAVLPPSLPQWPPFSFPPWWPFVHPANISAVQTPRKAPRMARMRTSPLTNYLCAFLWLKSLVCLSSDSSVSCPWAHNSLRLSLCPPCSKRQPQNRPPLSSITA